MKVVTSGWSNYQRSRSKRSRSVRISIITKSPYYPLLLCEIFDFRKVYWSPRFSGLRVCVYVFPVCPSSKALQAIVHRIRYIQFDRTCSRSRSFVKIFWQWKSIYQGQFRSRSKDKGLVRISIILYFITLRNLRFSQSILVTTVFGSPCLRVCFSRLSVFKGSTGHTDCPIVLILLAVDIFSSWDLAAYLLFYIG